MDYVRLQLVNMECAYRKMIVLENVAYLVDHVLKDMEFAVFVSVSIVSHFAVAIKRCYFIRPMYRK